MTIFNGLDCDSLPAAHSQLVLQTAHSTQPLTTQCPAWAGLLYSESLSVVLLFAQMILRLQQSQRPPQPQPQPLPIPRTRQRVPLDSKTGSWEQLGALRSEEQAKVTSVSVSCCVSSGFVYKPVSPTALYAVDLRNSKLPVPRASKLFPLFMLV